MVDIFIENSKSVRRLHYLVEILRVRAFTIEITSVVGVRIYFLETHFRVSTIFGNSLIKLTILFTWCCDLLAEPINIFHSSYKTDYEPIRVSYHSGVHYNAVLNPNKPSVGVGLGLSGYKPWVS